MHSQSQFELILRFSFWGMSEAVCLCLPIPADFSTFRAGCQGLSTLRLTHPQTHGHSESLTLRLTHTQTHSHRPLTLRFASKSICEDVSSEALLSAPHGGPPGGNCTGPFALRLLGCLRRFACLVVQTPLLSDQIVRTS